MKRFMPPGARKQEVLRPPPCPLVARHGLAPGSGDCCDAPFGSEQERRDVADGRVDVGPLRRMEARATETRSLEEWLRDHDAPLPEDAA